MREFTVELAIDLAQFERLYRGQASTVLARDVHGTRVSFPALSLRPFLQHTGIHGTFIIRVDGDNRLVEIRRAGD